MYHTYYATVCTRLVFDSNQRRKLESNGAGNAATSAACRILEDAVIEKKKEKKKKIAHFWVAYREAVHQWRRRLFGNGITPRRCVHHPPPPRRKINNNFHAEIHLYSSTPHHSQRQ